MTEEAKSFHGKDLQAMTLNMKEQRVLKKKLQTLQLEESFQIKTLNLDKKQIKLFQKRLCTAVGKIRSHLTADDIAFMKQLENEGKFIPIYNPVNVSHVGTISSAAKRLKLLTNEEILQLTQCDLGKNDLEDIPTPRDSLLSARKQKQNGGVVKPQVPESTTVSELPLNERRGRITNSQLRNGRSKSLPPPENTSKTNQNNLDTSKQMQQDNTIVTATEKLPSLESPSLSKQNSVSDDVDGRLFRPRSRSNSRASENLDEAATLMRPNTSISRPKTGFRMKTNRAYSSANVPKPPVRPLTTGGFMRSKSERVRPPTRPKTSTGVETSEALNYSSHKSVVLQPKSERASGRRISIMSSSSLGGEMAKERAEEVRKELLSKEQNRCNSIEDKRQVFLSRIVKWVEDNPSIIDNTASKFSLIEAKDLHLLAPDPNNQAIVNEGLFDEKDPDAWKDLKKCRYLRMADDKIDLSGINTLAKDNMHFFSGFRINYETPNHKMNSTQVKTQ